MATLGSFDKSVGVEYSLDQSKLKDKDIWYTDDTFTFYIGNVADQKFITVPKGFFTDGASVPRFAWVIFPPWGIYGQAAIVHDYLCIDLKLDKNGDNPNLLLTQRQADKILYRAMKVADTPAWKRIIIYLAVRAFHLVEGKG